MVKSIYMYFFKTIKVFQCFCPNLFLISEDRSSSAMLSKANLDQHVNGDKVAGSAPPSNHLFSRMIYSLLFCNANVEECLR